MKKLAPNERVLCASPGFVARFGKPSRPEDLRRLPCLVIRENDEDVSLWKLANEHCDQVSVRVPPALSSNDGEVVRTWAMEGRGIVLRSEWNVADDLRTGSLVRILPGWHAPSADIVALFASKHGRVARSERFVELLAESLAPVPWRS